MFKRGFLVLAIITVIFNISCKKNPTTSENTAPTALFTVDPTSGTTATTFTFDASGSSDNEDETSVLEVRWDWENDGVWDTDYRILKTIIHNFSQSGTHSIVLEVKDTEGLTSVVTDTINVIIANTTPTASFTVDPTSGTTATTFTFDGSGSSDNEDATSVLEVRWDWENDGVWDTNYSTTKTTTHQYATIGTHTVKMEVKDREGWVNSAWRTVGVSIVNTAPTASFTVDPTSGTTATTFTFDGSGSSDNEDATSVLEVRWDWENDGVWDTNYSTTKTTTHQYVAIGTHTVKMEVKDGEGWVNSAWRIVIVDSGNTAPIASFTVSPPSGNTGTTFNFDGSGSSDNEDATSVLEIRWDWENDGVWDTNYSTAKTTTHQYAAIGTYTVKMEVKDGEGWVNSAWRTVTVSTVSGNTAPTATIISNITTGTTTDAFWFGGGNSSDNEDPNSALLFRWDFENDGTWDIDFRAADDAIHYYSTTGTKTVKLEVMDTGGLIGTGWMTVTVSTVSGNTAPTATIISNITTGTTTDAFWFGGGNSSDNEDPNSALLFRWDFENDGTWDIDFRAADDAVHYYSTTGTKTVKLEVMDTGGLIGTGWMTVTVSTVSGNTAPTASIISNITTGTPSDAFWFGGGGSSDIEDPNSALLFRWDFENDGTWDIDYRSTDDAVHYYSTPGTYTVKLEVIDTGGLIGTAWMTVTVSAVNTAPTATIISNITTGTTTDAFWFGGGNSSDNEDPNSALLFRWDFENDGTWDIDFRAADDAVHYYSTTGTKTVKLEVMDTGGLIGTGWMTVTIN